MILESLPWIFQANTRNDRGETIERSVAFHNGVTHYREDNQKTGEVRYFRPRTPTQGERVDFDQLTEVDSDGRLIADWPPAPETQRSEARP